MVITRKRVLPFSNSLPCRALSLDGGFDCALDRRLVAWRRRSYGLEMFDLSLQLRDP
jgi:hypothetical protein